MGWSTSEKEGWRCVKWLWPIHFDLPIHLCIRVFISRNAGDGRASLDVARRLRSLRVFHCLVYLLSMCKCVLETPNLLTRLLMVRPHILDGPIIRPPSLFNVAYSTIVERLFGKKIEGYYSRPSPSLPFA